MIRPNGSGAAAAQQGYAFESPFIADPVREDEGVSRGVASPARVFGPEPQRSPFVSDYVLGSEQRILSPEAEAYASMQAELEDPEFAEALTDLVNETAALADARVQGEGGDPVRERIEAERQLRDYLSRVERESIRALEGLEASVGESNLQQLAESEVEALLETYVPESGGLTPAAENFVGKLVKKAKKAVKGAVGLAKRVGKLLPHNLILGKLKNLVRPLLERVLRFALDKLPASVRPIAAQLAKRFLGVAVPAGTAPAAAAQPADAQDGEPAAADASAIESEFDALVAGYIVEPEAFERYGALEAIGEDEGLIGDRLRPLRYARAQFARSIVNLAEGEDPRPHVERFVPAVLAALKLGISVIGRPRVVGLLSEWVSSLIASYVGKGQASTLSRALVDTGLRVVGLEAPDSLQEAGYTLAATVEDTVNRVVRSAPEAAWSNEALLEGYVSEAFEKAAAAHFPDALIRGELHETAGAPGAWQMLPAQSSAKHYKKYTRVEEVLVSPQVAAAVRSFGGTPVGAFFRDQLKLPVDQAVRARIHLYEAIPGTTLSLISLHEKVAGLGSKDRAAWSQIHPLTPEAAGLLLKEPGLGKPVLGRFLVDRNLVDVGQRFYFLEILGGGVPTRTGPPARTSQTAVVLDFPRTELRVFLYYSETEAQEIAQHLRRRAHTATVLGALRAGLDVRLSTILSGEPTRQLRVIHEAVAQEGLLPAAAVAAVMRVVGPVLARLVLRWLIEALSRQVEKRYDEFAAQFTSAADAALDGVTLALTFKGLPFLTSLRQMITMAKPPSLADVARMLTQGFGDVEFQLRPGYTRW